MFRKTKIAAVTAAVLGLSSVAFAPTAQAVSVNEAGATGQVLIFPYYNVNNGFSTTYNITNTTGDFKAIKIRFRESKLSNDVLDFNLYMSPYDMFTMGLNFKEGGGVTLFTSDNTCTHPKIPTTGVDFIDIYDKVENKDLQEGYLEVIEMGVFELDDDDVGVATVKVKVNGKTKTHSIASMDGIEHDEDGMPGNCDVIDLAWKQGVFVQGGAASNGVVGTAPDIHTVNPKAPTDYPHHALGTLGAGGNTNKSLAGFYGTNSAVWDKDEGALLPPTGGLVGSSVLIDAPNVAGFVVEPVSIVNYSDHAQHYLSSDEHFYLLPSLASGSIQTVDTLTDVTATSTALSITGGMWGEVARDYGLDDLNVLPATTVPSGINPMPIAHAMATTKVSNQYFLAGASTDWVFNQPMRKHGIYNEYEYVTSAQAVAAGITATNLPGDASYIYTFARPANATDAQKAAAALANGYWDHSHLRDVEGVFKYYDREEQTPTNPTTSGSFSPPRPTVAKAPNVFPLTQEVSIVALSKAGGSNASVLGSLNAFTYPLETGFVEGWGWVDFSQCAAPTAGNPGNTVTCDLAGPRYVANNSWTSFTPVNGGHAYGIPLSGFMSAMGGVPGTGGQSVGETFPHVITRDRN